MKQLYKILVVTCLNIFLISSAYKLFYYTRSFDGLKRSLKNNCVETRNLITV